MTDDTTGTETARWVGPCIDRFGAERPNHVRSSDDPYRCMICAAFNEGAALARIAELEAAPAAPTEARGPGEAWKPSDGDTKCQTCHQPNARWFTDNGLWNAVLADRVAEWIDGEIQGGDPGGCLCPRCFMLLAAERGVDVTWRLLPEWSGRAPLMDFLAEAAAPETEGPVAPCSRKDAHDPHEHWDVPASEPGEYRDAHICRGIEPFPTAEPLTAQPAAEGAREDDGLDRDRMALARNIVNQLLDESGMTDVKKRQSINDGCDQFVYRLLAEDRRRARAEGGAEALEAAAEAIIAARDGIREDCCDFCDQAQTDAALLRDRAAGVRETGGKG